MVSRPAWDKPIDKGEGEGDDKVEGDDEVEGDDKGDESAGDKKMDNETDVIESETAREREREWKKRMYYGPE